MPVGTRYTDAWARTQWEPDPDRFTVETPPDPAHGSTEELPNAVVMQDAPILQGGGEIYTDGIFENFTGLPTSHQIDQTPVAGGGTKYTTGSEKGRGFGNITRPMSSDEQYGRGILGAVRGRGQGANKDQTTEPPKYRFFNEQWFGLLVRASDPPPITQGPGDKILRRGLNAYPENDGEGGRIRGDGTSSWRVPTPSWKRGWYYRTNVNRDFSPPNRTHNHVRMVRPDIVTIIGDAPPPTKSDKYATPFSSLQRFLPRRRRLTGMRRMPGPWDEDIIAEYSNPISAVSADGMIVP